MVSVRNESSFTNVSYSSLWIAVSIIHRKIIEEMWHLFVDELYLFTRCFDTNAGDPPGSRQVHDSFDRDTFTTAVVNVSRTSRDVMTWRWRWSTEKILLQQSRLCFDVMRTFWRHLSIMDVKITWRHSGRRLAKLPATDPTSRLVPLRSREIHIRERIGSQAHLASILCHYVLVSSLHLGIFGHPEYHK
jgi:hypothetical protein